MTWKHKPNELLLVYLCCFEGIEAIIIYNSLVFSPISMMDSGIKINQTYKINIWRGIDIDLVDNL